MTASPFAQPFTLRPTERLLVPESYPAPETPEPDSTWTEEFAPAEGPAEEIERWVAEEMDALPWFTLEDLIEKVGAPRWPAWHPDNCNTPVAVQSDELALPCTLATGHRRRQHQVWDTDGDLMAESERKPSPRPRKVEQIITAGVVVAGAEA